jgi:hypothetical protein
VVSAVEVVDCQSADGGGIIGGGDGRRFGEVEIGRDGVIPGDCSALKSK